MWDLPRLGLEPVSPALAGGFLATLPPGKALVFFFFFFKVLKVFPGGAVVKNPPASAGDMGSSPGPGRSHMPQSN